jgi:HEAT repeat protein
MDPTAQLDSALAIARGTGPRAQRLAALELIGELAGRAHGADWPTAERAAFALLGEALELDTGHERAALVAAMGRAFRNVWLISFVHARLYDGDAEIVGHAIAAAGGLGFASLEPAVAEFLASDDVRLRRAAASALGRMGAVSAAARLARSIEEHPAEAAVALRALTEIRAPHGLEIAAGILEQDGRSEAGLAAALYLAELGDERVVPTLRRMARDASAEVRALAALGAHALSAERAGDAAERILLALAEPDRAARARLARRLRSLPVAGVLAEARVLLADDPFGVLQIIGELRASEVTHFLLEIGGRADFPVDVRARAIGNIEADEGWEREALARIIREASEPAVREAAARAFGAFASLEEALAAVSPLATDESPALRGAFLWAVQLAARPAQLTDAQRTTLEAALRRALVDPEPWVRRRAAYVTGNLRLGTLAAELVALLEREPDAEDLRLAAAVGLSELASPGAFDGLTGAFRREATAAVLAVLSRAIAETCARRPDVAFDPKKVQGKVAHLSREASAQARVAAARVAGAVRGTLPTATLLELAHDAVPRVRVQALAALGQLRLGEAESTLLAALDDADPAIHETAARALLALPGRPIVERLLAYASEGASASSRAEIAAGLTVAPSEVRHLGGALDAAIARLAHDDPAYEPLLLLKARAGGGDARQLDEAGLDVAMASLFPRWPRLAQVRAFHPLAQSMRTAEALYVAGGGLQAADHAPPIVLWMKALEGYTHAFFSPRLQRLQAELVAFADHVDRVVAEWPSYQRFLAGIWSDTVALGGARVDVPLRSAANVLREYQERRQKRLDAPLSVTEWARMMLFFAVDHQATRNVFKVASRGPQEVVRLAHRLHTLAAVRNLVTHREPASAATLEAFRRAYYAAFEDLTGLAG